MPQVQATFNGVVVHVELRIGGQPVRLSKRGKIWEGLRQLELPDGITGLELSFAAPPLLPEESGHFWSLQVVVGRNLVFDDTGVTASDDFFLRTTIRFCAA
jgi:hypothetical protein